MQLKVGGKVWGKGGRAAIVSEWLWRPFGHAIAEDSAKLKSDFVVASWSWMSSVVTTEDGTLGPAPLTGHGVGNEAI